MVAQSNQDNSQPPVNYGGGFFDGLIIGVVVGAVGYYLFGTEEGKKVKDKLLQEGKQELKDLTETAQEVVKKELPQIKEVIQDTVSEGQTLIAEELPAIKEEISNELKQLEDTVEVAKQAADIMEQQLQQTASKIEKKFFMRKGRSLKK